MKREFVTPAELKKIMKVSLSLKIELSFYVSFTDYCVEIDERSNSSPDNVKTFYFKDNYLGSILNLVRAYSRLFKRKLSIR